MPKISIFEKDLTTAGIENITNNIAYIPGYAIMGPANTPILCETLEDFQNIFGAKPYKFEVDQDMPNFEANAKPDGKFALKGTYEKSYIIAVELLKNGLPIIFERVMNKDKISTLQAKATITFTNTDSSIDAPKFSILAKNPGKYGNNIGYKVTALTSNYTQVDSSDYAFLLKDANYTIDSTVTSNNFDQVKNTIYIKEAANSYKHPTEFDQGTTYYKATTTKVYYKYNVVSSEYEKVMLPADYTENTTYFNVSRNYQLNVTLYKNTALGIAKDTVLIDDIEFSFDTSKENYYLNTLISDELEFIQSGLINNDNILTTNTNVAYLNVANGSDEFNVTDIYSAMSGDTSIFNKLTDKGEYQLKFITSGAYPTFEYGTQSEIAKIMLRVAAERGDALAIIDHTNKITRKIIAESGDSIYKSLQSLPSILVGASDKQEDARKYGAMFTPWATYYSTVLDTNSILPASFAYLNTLAVSVRTNENWYAIAGIARGQVPNILQLSQNVTGAIAESIQNVNGISMDPITMIKPYGYCIWGNRTLNMNKGLVASSFLNIRALVNDVKKVVYAAAKKLTFDLNSDVTWLNFKSEIEPTLDKMVSGNGISNYKILRQPTTKKATISAIIKLYPIEAVEDWDITIELSDTVTSVL